MEGFDSLRKKANNAIASFESVLSTLQEVADAQLGRISELNEQTVEVQREAETTKAELKDLKLATAKEIKQLEASVKPLRTEKHKLDSEISVLVGQKGDLKMDNARLETANKDFRSYEEGAWKVLRAKDEELQGREEAVRQKEQLTPTSSSLLPPRA